jgi:hypothetical protein
MVSNAIFIYIVWQGIGHYEALNQYPEVMKKLDDLEREITGGTTATVALVYKGKLYVANVGKSVPSKSVQNPIFKSYRHLICSHLINHNTFLKTMIMCWNRLLKTAIAVCARYYEHWTCQLFSAFFKIKLDFMRRYICTW